MADTVVFLVRHASAGESWAWPGDDADRPLDERGMEQALQIAAVVASRQPVRVISAPPVRCVDTVAPLAEAAGIEVEIDPLFGEESAPDDPERHLLEVAVPGAAVVVCSQGGVIPRVLLALLGRREDVKKGSIWALTLDEGRVSGELMTY